MPENVSTEKKELNIESLFEAPEKFVASLTPEQLKEFNSAVSKRMTDEEIALAEQDISYELITDFFDNRVKADGKLTRYNVFSYQSQRTRRMNGDMVVQLFSSPLQKGVKGDKEKFKDKELGSSGEILNLNNERYKFTFVVAETRPFKKCDGKMVKF